MRPSKFTVKFVENNFLWESWVKVEHSNSTTFHSIARDDSNTLMAGSQYPFSGSIGDVPIGTGVEDAPFMVYFADDMRKVGTEPDGWSLSSHYKLAQDIDLGGEEFTTIGSYDHSIDLRFKGTFDGDGYEISGLYINQPDADCQGLFGYIIDATIKNLGVSGSVTGRICVGGIVGCSHNSSIENCYNKATIVGYGYNIGGIAGSGTTINNCFNTGSVTGSGDDEDSYSVGGIAGECSGELSNCYNTGAVKSSSGHAVGGVAGINIEVVSNSYNIGSVTGNIDVGGVVGYQSIPDDLGTTTYSYYDSEVVTGVEGAVDGENSGTDYCGLSKTNMQGAASTDGTLLYYLTNESYGDSSEWVADTENINGGYPILTWQTSNN